MTRDAKGNLYGTTEYGGPSGVGVVYKIDSSGTQTVVYSFSGTDGAYPMSGVILDPSGNLYGTTEAGGAANQGVVYKIDPAGAETVLYSFTGAAGGGYPYAGVVRDSAGNLYGTAPFGSSGGVLYKVDAAGTETVIFTFTGGFTGSDPYGGVILDSAGNLYGVTYYGGTSYSGVIYEISPTGNETILYNFPGGSGGEAGYASLTLDAAGNLYGTAIGGPSGYGIVYKLPPGGQPAILHAFTGGADGGDPEYASVVVDEAGNVYGTTTYGGADNYGVVYEIGSSGNETVLHSFAGGGDGAEPFAGVFRDSSGDLYGTTLRGGRSNEGLVFEINHKGQKTNIYGFPAMQDGANPSSGLIGDPDGNFYGVTSTGGLQNLGVVYKISRGGEETVLHWFAGGSDGANPKGNLARDSNGNLYGATVFGGPANAGTVFQVSPSGDETVLYAFTGGSDGLNPEGGVVLDPSGNVYGTASWGGLGWGTVFEVSPAGALTVLYSFEGNTDGGAPMSNLIRDSSGNLYGTAEYAGRYGSGVVFMANSQGEVPLYSFEDSQDGAYPVAGVVMDTSGNLYGTTPYAGGEYGDGTIFEVETSGHETTLYNFDVYPSQAGGYQPYAGVIRDSSGNLYGTTSAGGASGQGVVYELSASGQETVLHSFTGGNDGSEPSTPLLLDGTGKLYGTTQYGGQRATGVVFVLKP